MLLSTHESVTKHNEFNTTIVYYTLYQYTSMVATMVYTLYP